MFLKIKSILLISIAAFTMSVCQKEEKKDNTGTILALVQTNNLNTANASLAAANANLATERNSQFILNGSWNSFTGNATTGAGSLVFNARSGSDGASVSGNGTSTTNTSVYVISQFDNSAGFYVAQNPTGGAFTGFADTFKGKFFKTIFFAEGTKYWTCTIFNAQDTVSAAAALADNTTRTNPGTTGCGGFSWSRLERK